MFDVFFTLNGLIRRIVDFEINQAMDAKAFRVTLHQAIAMLVYAPDEIACDADVDCVARPAR